MKKQQIHIAELSVPQPVPDTAQPKNYIETLQTAILLSLFEKGQLSKRQLDLCLKKLPA